MSRAARIAKIRRDLQELLARMLRIEQETFAGKRNVKELADELRRLETESDHA